MKIILQKYIAQSGYCSRRKAEQMVKAGRVKVNGNVAKIAAMVDEDDKISIGGNIVQAKSEKLYIALNKPKGYTCTNRKFKGEKNVFDLLPKKFAHLHIVGRLDKDSRGLVVLTNDGALTQRVTHPKFAHEKNYLVKVRPKTKTKDNKINVPSIVGSFNKGVYIGNGDGVVKIKNEDIDCIGNNTFRLTLREGKKRQIKRMFKEAECEVIDLSRTSIGELNIGDLKTGKWERLNTEQILLL